MQNAEEIHREFASAASAGDVDRLLKLYEPDAVVISPPGESGSGERREGLDAIRRHLTSLVAMRPQMQVEASQVHVKDDLALLSSRWRATVALPDGSATELAGHGSELARRQPDGSWRLVIDNPGGAG
jgi:uncharacterized protein (TIGR02246 family)